MMEAKASSNHPRSHSFTLSSTTTTSTPVSPPSIKPTSRARAYRIPNTSDTIAGDAASKGGGTTAGGDSFLWATREIAALDFLMNVPLCAEREIVRAGLSGERWRHNPANIEPVISKQSKHPDESLGVLHETSETVYGVPAQPITPHRWSNFNLSRNLSEDDSTATVSSVAVSDKTGTIGSSSETTSATGGRWWDKLISKDKRFFSAANQQQVRREQLEMEERDLECPDDYEEEIIGDEKRVISTPTSNAARISGGIVGIPGRRLDGREAVTLELPIEFRTRPLPIRAVGRHAAVREWEMKVAWHGVVQENVPGRHYHHTDDTRDKRALLDGRVFFSSKKSYPISVFSCIKYEPQKEEAARRRKKLEELGGGGTQFVLPERDWRGISYRALLPQKAEKKVKVFNRLFATASPSTNKAEKKADNASSSNGETSDEDTDDEEDLSTSSDECCDGYMPGFLDDPDMKQGRHRNVMVGDKITGPIISSTIQFVKPSVLKAELNKQFRERFDQWEPPKSQRKFIGATVIDGVYTLIDPTETAQEDGDQTEKRRPRAGSLGERESIRMPPSLTLSKIRSLKQQALVACVRSQIELSTLALACVYFERLCLDCRVDKSNRRLSFAACLLLAAKVNESNTIMAFDPGAETKSWVKPSKKSGRIFESLIVFFTHDWSISLKQLYAAEWIVFSALGFSLRSTPSQVAFHFKRLLKVLEWDSRSYLGNEMYSQWQDCLVEESRRKEIRKARREMRLKRNERRLLKLQRRLHTEGIHRRSSTLSSDSQGFRRHSIDTVQPTLPATPHREAQPPKAESPAVRSILSRLARPKMATQHSHGEDLDRLPKQEKKIAWARHAYSTPNLKELDKESKKDNVTDDGKIPEGEMNVHS